MKTGFTTYWVPESGADLKALEAQHQRTFKGNKLAIVSGFVKVAVLDGDTPPKGATTQVPVSKFDMTANGTLTGNARL